MVTAREKREAARAAVTNFKPQEVKVAVHESNAPKTGPGVMMAAISAVDPQINQLTEQLQERNAKVQELMDQVSSWEGDAHTKLIDSSLIVESRWANRHKDSFASPEFAQLKLEIESAGGNVQPIKVRAKGDKYEVVFGHRRARACRELGLPVLAVVVEAMSDLALFTEMDRENRQRADLSAWEQGVMYERALTEGLFPSQRKLAEALGIDLSNAGKCLALARLPDAVIGAFKSPLEIQLRWGGKLAKAYESDPDGLVQRAKSIAKLQPRPKAAEVFERLVNPQKRGSGSEPPPQPKVQIKADGSATIKFPPSSLDQADLASIQKLIDDFLALKKV